MLKRPINKLFWWIFGIHAAVIGGLLIAPLFHRRPKEIVTFVEFVSEPAPVEQPVEVPVPIEEPVIEEVVIDLPAPTNNVEKAKAPEKPKWKAAKVIPQNKRVTKTSEKPAPVTTSKKRISASDIRKALGSGGGMIGQVDAYDTMLSTRFYAVWQVPVGAAYGTSAVGSITVGRDGTVANRKLITPSGHAAFDQSVRNALSTVNRLPTPPSERINQPITIKFEPQ